MKQALYTLYLRYDSQFRTLTKIALAQLLLKIIFFLDNNDEKGVSLDELNEELRSIVGGEKSKQEVEEALSNLVTENKVILTPKSTYSLSEETYLSISNAHKKSDKRHDDVIDYWFGKAESKRECIRNWFEGVTVEFFKENKHIWFNEFIKNGNNNKKHIPKIGDILTVSLQKSKHIVEKDKEWLKSQYLKFIDSSREVDNLILLQYGISMFSSSVLMSGSFADKMSIETFKDSIFVLDTNVLIGLQLDYVDLSSSLKELENSFRALNIKPRYIRISKDEYHRAIDHNMDMVLRVVDKYSYEVITDYHLHNDFIESAVNRGCKNLNDFERFFSEIKDLPEVLFKDLPIEAIDFKELADAIEIGQNNEKLNNEIDRIHSTRVNKPKRERARKHDTGLIAALNFLRKENKAWLLTRDGTIRKYAKENIIRDEPQITVSVEALISMLALDNGGVEVDPGNFAPLFANMIKLSLEPQENVFEIEDLAYLLDTEIQINNLPDDKVVEIASELNKKRLEQKSEDEIGLFIRRKFEKERISLAGSLDQTKRELFVTNEKLKSAEEQRENLINSYRKKRNKELKLIALKKRTRNRILSFIIVPLIIIGLLLLCVYFSGIEGTYPTIIAGILISITAGILISNFFINPKVIKNANKEIESIEEKIKQEIQQMHEV